MNRVDWEALLQSEAAVVERTTRAKAKIRGANFPLRVPPAELLPDRVPRVLGRIDSVFTEGYWYVARPSAIRDELWAWDAVSVPVEK